MKDYIKITDMSARFEEWSVGRGDQDFTDLAKNLAWEARRWELRFQLAIAQQLSIVASHLGKITRKAEQLNDQD